MKPEESGRQRIEWVASHMPVLGEIGKLFEKEKPFAGKKIAASLHIEPKTAMLALTLKKGGAEVAICACNPLTTQDDTAAYLATQMKVYARRGFSEQEQKEAFNKALDIKPDIFIDDGADLTALLHKERSDLSEKIKGGCEETTTGVIRIKALEKEGKLKFPMIAVNSGLMKHMFDNRYGTGQSVIDGIMTATNLTIAGKNLVMVGYGWCGRGIAMRMKGLGARVTVTEIDPIKALEAEMDGFYVMPLEEAAANADYIIAATGSKNVVDELHMKKMKNGCMLANAGHFNDEINIDALERLSSGKKEAKQYVTEYSLKDGRALYLLGGGRLINLVAGQGHPAEIMDLSFSLQAMGARYVLVNSGKLSKKVYTVPDEIDAQVAQLCLKARGTRIDKITAEQGKYRNSWDI